MTFCFNYNDCNSNNLINFNMFDVTFNLMMENKCKFSSIVFYLASNKNLHIPMNYSILIFTYVYFVLNVILFLLLNFFFQFVWCAIEVYSVVLYYISRYVGNRYIHLQRVHWTPNFWNHPKTHQSRKQLNNSFEIQNWHVSINCIKNSPKANSYSQRNKIMRRMRTKRNLILIRVYVRISRIAIQPSENSGTLWW